MENKALNTIGHLKKVGWQSKPIKQEMKDNLLQSIVSNAPIMQKIHGYENTVFPQVQNAILARHDMIFLGLRGQGKTKIAKLTKEFLDEYIPYIEGSPLYEDPFQPLLKTTQEKIKIHGDETPIKWLHRDERVQEKLATPDVSIADLIGDIDPIKAAKFGLDLSNEEVIHWGIIPRCNRHIFIINELPDLQSRIQVSLLNILEDSNLQLKGFPIAIPLDILFIFTANPEDYTNRGNIITPLKDRINSQIITHYPHDVSIAQKITKQEVNCEYELPRFYHQMIENIIFEARQSDYIDKSSGVSTRASIACYECIHANILKRKAKYLNETFSPRIVDLYAAIPAITGKIELVYEGEELGLETVALSVIQQSINKTFHEFFPPNTDEILDDMGTIKMDSRLNKIIAYFEGNQITIDDQMTQEKLKASLEKVSGLMELAQSLQNDISMDQIFIAEFILEGLSLNNMIGKTLNNGKTIFNSLFNGLL